MKKKVILILAIAACIGLAVVLIIIGLKKNNAIEPTESATEVIAGSDNDQSEIETNEATDPAERESSIAETTLSDATEFTELDIQETIINIEDNQGVGGL